MDELKQQLMSRAGIDSATADKVIETVTNFAKENPEKFSSLLGDDGPAGRLKGLLG